MPFHPGFAQRALTKPPGRFPAFTCTEFHSPDFQQLSTKIYQCSLESHFYLADNWGVIGGGMFQRHPFIKTQEHAWTISPHVQYGQMIAQRTEVTGIAVGKPYWLVGVGTAVFTGTQAMGILGQTPFLEPFEKFFQNAPTTQWWLYAIVGSATYFVDVLKDKGIFRGHRVIPTPTGDTILIPVYTPGTTFVAGMQAFLNSRGEYIRTRGLFSLIDSFGNPIHTVTVDDPDDNNAIFLITDVEPIDQSWVVVSGAYGTNNLLQGMILFVHRESLQVQDAYRFLIAGSLTTIFLDVEYDSLDGALYVLGFHTPEATLPQLRLSRFPNTVSNDHYTYHVLALSFFMHYNIATAHLWAFFPHVYPFLVRFRVCQCIDSGFLISSATWAYQLLPVIQDEDFSYLSEGVLKDVEIIQTDTVPWLRIVGWALEATFNDLQHIAAGWEVHVSETGQILRSRLYQSRPDVNPSWRSRANPLFTTWQNISWGEAMWYELGDPQKPLYPHPRLWSVSYFMSPVLYKPRCCRAWEGIEVTPLAIEFSPLILQVRPVSLLKVVSYQLDPLRIEPSCQGQEASEDESLPHF